MKGEIVKNHIKQFIGMVDKYLDTAKDLNHVEGLIQNRPSNHILDRKSYSLQQDLNKLRSDLLQAGPKLAEILEWNGKDSSVLLAFLHAVKNKGCTGRRFALAYSLGSFAANCH